jgi:hypothetical protein
MNICNTCKQRACTVNYYRKGKAYYRKQCNQCIREQKLKKVLPAQLLKKSGYKKKFICDRCGFKAKNPAQIKIHYKDQNPYNVSVSNLKSYCANCVIEITHDPDADRQTILADF